MRLITTLCVIVTVSLGMPVLADEIDPPNVGLSCGHDDPSTGVGESVPWTPTLTHVPSTTQFTSSGTFTPTDEHWTVTWTNMTVDTDPFISGTFAVKNNMTTTQNFTFMVSMPVAALAYCVMGGSVGGSLTDANYNGSGSLSTVSPAPLYYGMIDGTGVLPIYASGSWPITFAGETVSITAVNSGLPGPTIPGPAVTTDIGIQLRFALSPGDTAAFTSFFVVEVPEPASLSLLALGGLALLRRKH